MTVIDDMWPFVLLPIDCLCMHMSKWGAHYVRSLLRAHSLQQVHGGGGGDDDDDDDDIDGRVPRECCSHSLLPPPPSLDTCHSPPPSFDTCH